MFILLMLRRASVLGVLCGVQAVAFGQTAGTALPLAAPANVWLNAGSGVTTSGSAVTTWADQSGNTGRNATQDTSTAQPTFVTSSVAFAGQPVLQFDGGDWLSGTWRAANGAAQASMFAVYQLASNGGVQVPVMVGPGATSQGFGMGWNSNGYFNSFLWGGGADSRINGFNSNTLIQAGTINGGTGSVWLNGQTATASGGSASLGNGYNVGRSESPSFPFPLLNGSQLAEIVIFESALGAADVTTMGNYLAAKYGVATTTSRLWSGGSSDATAAANWGGTLASGDQLVFQGATATSPTVGSTALSVAGIAFAKQTAGATATAAFTLGGTGTITLGANGIANWAAATQTIAAPLSLSVGSAWNAVGDLVVSGNIAGTGGLTKAGGGTLTLSGSNSYAGGTTVNTGVLALLSPAAQPASGATTVANGAGLSLGVGSGLFSVTDFETLHDTGSLPNVTLGLTSLAGVDTTAGDVSISSALEGTRGVVKTGSGTLTLSGSNTYSGPTVLSAGTLRLTNALAVQASRLDFAGGTVELGAGVTTPTFGGLSGATDLASGITAGYASVTGLTLNPAAGVTATFSGAIADGVAGTTLSKTGAGTQVLSGSNTYTGETIISAGTLSVTTASALGSGSLSLGAGTLEVTGSTAFFTNRAVALTGGGSFAVANSGGMTLSGVLSGAGGFTKTGTGSLTLSARNTYSGPTVVNEGTLIAAAANGNDCIRGAITINPGATLQLNVQNCIPDTSPITINAGTFAMQTNMEYIGNLTLGGGAIVSGSGTGTQSLITNGVANSKIATTGTGLAGTISSRLALASQFGTVTGNRTQNFEVGTGARLDVTGAIIDTQPGSAAFVGTLLKTGAGELRLSGTNTYSGGTTLSAGTLRVTSPSGLGTGDVAVQAGGRLSVAAALVLGGTSAVSIAEGGFLTVEGGGSLPLAESASLRGFESPSSAGGTTLAAIRSGVSNGGTLSVNWLTGPQNSFSDAIDLVTGTGTIAPFVLQMNFDAGLAGGVKDSLMLGWLDPATSQWVNAVAGNTAGSSTFFAGSWDAYLLANPGATATTALGAYGVDPVGNTVWAAVDHNSEFAVIAVPEPGTLSLAGLALAAAGAAAARRRRRGR